MASNDEEKLPSSSSFRMYMRYAFQASLTCLQDRLPTVSASQALLKLKTGGPKAISTSLPRLDSLLLGQGVATQPSQDLKGGFSRGHVTEVYGPPGAGKTALW